MRDNIADFKAFVEACGLTDWVQIIAAAFGYYHDAGAVPVEVWSFAMQTADEKYNREEVKSA